MGKEKNRGDPFKAKHQAQQKKDAEDRKTDSKKDPNAKDPNAPKIGRGHKNKGAGTVVTDKGPRETKDGFVVKTGQELPSQIVRKWCQKNKRPNPRFVNAKSWEEGIERRRCILPDPKGDSEKDLKFAPWASAIGATTHTMAIEEACLVAIYQHIGPTLPLERTLPDPFKDLWKDMVAKKEGCLQPDSYYTSEKEKNVEKFEKKQEQRIAKNEKETKRTYTAEQNVQPIFFSTRMRELAIKALKLKEKDIINLDGLEDSEKNSILNKFKSIFDHFVNEVGFEHEDVGSAVLSLQNSGEVVDIENVSGWLSLHTPEESLPDKFRIKGQFNLNSNQTAKVEEAKGEDAVAREHYLNFARNGILKIMNFGLN